MIKDLSHYWFDGGPFVLFDSVTWILLATILIWRGVLGDSRFPLWKMRQRTERKQWIEELCAWRIAASEGQAAAMLPPIQTSWRRLQAPALVGAGIGILIAFCLLAAASGALTGSLLLLTAMMASPVYASLFFFGAIGYAAGLTHGANRVRRELRDGVRYDTAPRSLASYRSRRVPLLLVGVVLFNLVTVVVEAPYISPQIHIDVAGGTQYLVPTSAAVVALPLACMVLAIAAMESLAARIVSLPGLASGIASTEAMRVDDMVRTKGVMAIEAAEVVVVAALALTEVFLTDWGLGYAHSTAVDSLGLAALFLSFLVGGAGMFRLVGGPSAAEFTDWLYAPRGARWRTHSSI